MKQKLLALLMPFMLCGIPTLAHDIEVGGIYYVYSNNGTELSVSYRGNSSSDYSNEYSGNVVIPESVTYNGTTYPVTSIRERAFYNCSGLTSVTIPNSVTKIGKFAFDGCFGLTSITIPNSVTSIGEHAFYWCTSLTSVTIPNSVTSIGVRAFSRCPNLNSVKVDAGNTVYDSRNNCNAIINTASNTLVAGCKNTVIPNSVSSIGEDAFNGCSNLISATIPNSVTSIGLGAFSGCYGLTSVTIPNSVTSIGDYAFSGCSGLTSITIPNSVTSIGEYAFWDCSDLTTLTIPYSITSIGKGTFNGCSSIESIIVEEGNPVYDSRNYCNAIIETASNKLVQGCKNTIIPNDIVEIGYAALSNIGTYANITIPASVSVIGSYAFYGYVRLNVTFNQSTPPTLADKAFSDLSKVYAIVPKGCTSSYSSIGFKQITEKNEDYHPLVTINLTDAGTLQEMALDIEETDIRNLKLVGPINSVDINYLRTSARFTNISYLDMSEVILTADDKSYCSSDFGKFYLSDVSYSYPITYDSGLGFYSAVNQFYGNSFAGVFIGMKVKEVILPSHLTRIGAYCFANCTELQKIVIPDGVTTIEEGAFLGCNSLTEIKLPSSVTKISNQAFRDCVSLMQITSLDNVTEIGLSAFSNNVSLLYVGSLDNVKQLDKYAFYGCSSLIGDKETRTIDLSGVFDIPDYAFSQCAKLGNVIFSDKLQSIGKAAFAQCTNLRSVNLPESTKAVMPEAFYGCTRLSVVSYSRNLLQVAKSTFTDTPFFASLECVDGIKYMGHIAMCIEGDPVSRISFREGTLSIADDFIYTSSNKDYTTVCTELLLPNSLLRIGNSAFTKGYKGLGITKLTLPDNLLEIGDNAFSYSKSISQITLPESLIYVGNAAFYGCDGLVRVIYNANSLMSNITTTGYGDGSSVHGIFEGTGIEKVTIGPKVRILPSAVFMECEKLMKVEFADRTSDDHLYVGPYSFYSCKALTNIVLPESTDSIGIYAFRFCRALSNVTLPDSIQRVGKGAFKDCPWLDTYLNNQPDGVVYVGLVAFGYKGNMPEGTTISLREGTKSIAYMAFDHCDGMEHLIIPNTVEIIGDYAFSACNKLKSIKMGNGIISIGNDAFRECNALSSIELPEYVKTIGASAFSTCRNLKKITIGKNVSEIGNVAFYGLENISDVTVLRENPEDYNCSNAVFESHGVSVISIGTTYYSHPENATLHVPEGCIDVYRNCYPWSRFGTIVDDAVTSVLQPTIEIMPLNESRTYDNTFIYDLQGRRVTNPRKGGVYIIGGKKVIK